MRDAITGNVMFYYDRGSCGHHVAREILDGYRGNVQCDGYEAYDQFEKVPGITGVRLFIVHRLVERERTVCHGGHTLYKKTVQGGE